MGVRVVNLLYNVFMKGRRIKGIEKYSDQWIALDESRTKIIVGGKDLKKVMSEATKKADKPSFMKVPRLDAYFAP